MDSNLARRFNYYYDMMFNSPNEIKLWNKITKYLNSYIKKDSKNKILKKKIGEYVSTQIITYPNIIIGIMFLTASGCRDTRAKAMAKSIHDYYYHIVNQGNAENLHTINELTTIVLTNTRLFVDDDQSYWFYLKHHSLIASSLLSVNDFQAMNDYMQLSLAEISASYGNRDFQPINAEWYEEGLNKLKTNHSIPIQMILTDWLTDSYNKHVGNMMLQINQERIPEHLYRIEERKRWWKSLMN